jgi:hypothetical protein
MNVYAQGQTEYFLKWEGYPHSANTWEKASDLFCHELVEEFERTYIAEDEDAKSVKNELKPEKDRKPRASTRSRDARTSISSTTTTSTSTTSSPPAATRRRSERTSGGAQIKSEQAPVEAPAGTADGVASTSDSEQSSTPQTCSREAKQATPRHQRKRQATESEVLNSSDSHAENRVWQQKPRSIVMVATITIKAK